MLNKKQKYIINIFLIVLLSFLVEQFFCICIIKKILIKNWMTFLLSTGIILSFTIFLWGLTGKSCVAIAIDSGILSIVSFINIIKIYITSDPLLFSDFSFVSSTGELFNLVKLQLLDIVSANYFNILAFIAIIVIILVISIKSDIKIKRKERWLYMIIALSIIFLLFYPFEFTKNIILKKIYKNNTNKAFVCGAVNLQYYIKNGFLGGMYGQMLENIIVKPEGYSEENLNRILEEISNVDLKEKMWGKPNIIVIFSEAFWDVSKIEEVKFDKDVTYNFKRLQNQGIAIELLSPSYGGLSANVDFELLTGGTLRYFGMGYVPLTQLHKNRKDNEIISLVKELNKNNYHTKIVFGHDYYNAKKEFLRLGFNEYIELEQNMENMKGGYASDEYMADLIIKELEQKDKNQKLFYMSETIQNHMPFYKEKYENYDLEVTYSEFDKEKTETVQAFAQGIYDADEQLGRIYDYIQTYDEPTIILFMGDHLPYLKTEKGINIFNYSKYFNTGNQNENNYRLYNTEALILANFDLDTQTENPKYLGTDLLLNYILNNMDIDLQDYYKWLDTTRKEIKASNFLITIDSEDNIHSYNNLSEKITKADNLRERMQYKFFIK